MPDSAVGAADGLASLERHLTRSRARVDILEKAIEDKTRALFLANEELNRTNHFLAGVLRSMLSAVFVTGSDAVITAVEGAAAGITGFDEGTLIGRPIVDILTLATDGPSAASGLQPAGSSGTGEAMLATRGGGAKPVLLSWSELASDDGTVDGMVYVASDISELKRLELELLQAQKLESVGQLAAGIAHEINTPMQYIGDNTRILQLTVERLLDIARAAETVTATGSTERDREALASAIEKARLPLLSERAPAAADDVLAGVQSVSQIVNAMKRFSHPSLEEMGTVDLNDSITTTVAVSRGEWKYAADLETELVDGLPTIEGRAGRLNQVWLNMIINAAHAVADNHAGGKGLITIGTAAIDQGRAVQVRIADDGPGIAPEIIDRIFDHFFTTKEVGRGTGQGLSVAHNVIVAEHNGELAVDSTPGQGTTFTVTLPTTQPRPEEETDAAALRR